MIRWIERQRYFLDFTLSSLSRRIWKNTALLLVYTIIVFAVASVAFFSESIRREAVSTLAGSPAMIVQRTLAGRHEVIPIDYAQKIKGIRGVQNVKGRLWGYYFHPASGANYTVMALDVFNHADDEIAVGDGVLRTWGSARGNDFYFKTHDGESVVLKMVESFKKDSDLVSADLILMSENAFKRIFGIQEGYATDLVVEVRNQKECTTIAEKIVKMLPGARPIQREEILRTYSSLFDWRSGYTIVLLSGAILAFFIFAWDKATGLGADEKAEIGILKGLGWETSDVLHMKFWEGVVISLTAFLLGCSLAYVHVFFTHAPLFEHALKGWSVLYPKFRLTPTVDWYQLSVLFALVVIPYACITIIPAWRIAVSDPDAVMR